MNGSTFNISDENLWVNISNDNCTIECNITNNDQGMDNAAKMAINVLNYFNYVLLPTILVLGLVGNTLTLLVMNTQRFANQTSRIFLSALSISDSTLLLTQIFNKAFVINLLGFDIRALSEFGCKAFFVIFKTSKMTSSWFLVFMCVERFVAVWFPLKSKFIITKTVALIGIALTYLVIGSFTSVWSYASKIDNDGICHPDEYNRTNKQEVEVFGRYIITGISLYSIIPTIIMVIITPLIILRLVSRAKLTKKMTGKTKKKQTETNKITIMLVGIILAYITLILPVTALHLSAFLFRVNAFGNSQTSFIIFREVSQILEQINYAINFFLYILTSSVFRSALKDIFCIKQMIALRRQFARSRENGDSSRKFDGIEKRDNGTCSTRDSQSTKSMKETSFEESNKSQNEGIYAITEKIKNGHKSGSID